MSLTDNYQLADRYRRDDGRVFLSGSQALARLPLEQLRADRRAGWNTAAFVSGYQGSPLANYDRDVTAVAKLAKEDGYPLIFQPGLNEELAATAVMGSQLTVTLDSCKYDGVIGLWYGKGPGLDRASDAIRHAVFAGTAARGGAVALVGDDPKAKSSTIPSSSDATLMDLHIPVFYPGDVQEAIDLGRHAIALSRACGLWTSIKIVEAVADGTGTVELHPERINPVIRTMEVNGRTFVPMPSGRLLTPFTLELEHEFKEVRLPLAQQYGVDNHLNTVSVRGPNDWLGIIATGHTYHETLHALRLLGLHTADDLRDAGIRLLQLRLPVPLDPALVRHFAEGLAEVCVVEEKNPSLEWLVKDALYATTNRPLVTGKRNPDGTILMPETGTLDSDTIAPRLRTRLQQRLSSDRLAPPPPTPRQLIPLAVQRTPYFCSGCPHNSSTKVPDGVLVGGGIGCHSMVMNMEEDRVGHLVGLTAMGNEGSQWIGMAPFVGENHLIQNIGDGTLFHSGILAVRAAAASGVNITFKVLYNGAVAMTGGQDPYGQIEVPALAQALLSEGVVQVLITTDDVGKYRHVTLPDGVKVWGRDRLIEAQELLATVPGCTVLIHDQRCAAELRRDRKRGTIDKPTFKVLINERVCEGCGDCGDVSNCLSVQPVDTAFGRKTRIDQGSCNFDLSCMDGDCPSFTTVTPRGDPVRAGRARGTVPAPPPAPTVEPRECTIRLSGIGGTGVVTVSQILGTAAMIDGYFVRGLDQTGLSQKAGPVVSDLLLNRTEPTASNKATAGSVDVLVAFDQLVAGSDTHLAGTSAERTVVIANSASVPTGSMVIHPERAYPVDALHERLTSHSRRQVTVDAATIVRGVLGDESTTNVFMLGIAVQQGDVPVNAASVEQAISLNGVAVEKNLKAFALGRTWVTDATAVESAAGIEPSTTDDMPLVDRLATDLVGYQSKAYADRFRAIVATVDSLDQPELTDAVARHLHKLMAYKDEYEVARLLLLPESKAAAKAIGGKRAKVVWHLHPPILRSLGMRRKIRLGSWATPLFWALRAGRRLRGTPVDVFGLAKVRRIERAMVDEYIAAVDVLVKHVGSAPLEELVAIASLRIASAATSTSRWTAPRRTAPNSPNASPPSPDPPHCFV